MTTRKEKEEPIYSLSLGLFYGVGVADGGDDDESW
jgi:hypothetical protein